MIDPGRRAVRALVVGPVSRNEIVRLAALPDGQPGTQFARASWVSVGGTSAGKALNLAQLRADIAVATVLGRDAAGEQVRHALGAAGVAVHARPSASGTTERHLNLMDDAGQRRSIYLDAPPPAEPWDRATAAALFEPADVVAVDLAAHARPWLDWLATAGVACWCDLHDDDGVDSFRAPFRAADHLLVSSERLPDWRRFGEARIESGAQTVGVTHGAAGASGLEAGGAWVDVPAEPATIVDTNGAGDAFFAGFVVARAAGGDLPSALRAGARQAARCVAGRHLAGDLGGVGDDPG